MPIKGDKKFDETEVLVRAMNLFWKQGYEATGTAQLVKEMGIGRQSVYDTFGTKRDLFLQAINHYAKTKGRILTTQLRGEGNYLEQLKQQFKVWGDFALNHEEGCLMVNTLAELAAQDEEIQIILTEHNNRIEQRLTETIELAIETGEISETVNAQQTARALVALLNGLFLLSKTKPSKVMVDSVIFSAEKLLD